MRLSLFFAVRYLFSKKTLNAINIISAISLVGVLISSAALVIVLSFYNGLESFIFSQYQIFSSDLRLEPSQGKLFDPDSSKLLEMRNSKDFTAFVEVLEEKVLVEYKGQQYIGRIKGIDPSGMDYVAPKEMLMRGKHAIRDDHNMDYAILGAQAQAALHPPLNDKKHRLSIYTPRKNINPATSLNHMEEISTRQIISGGVLQYQAGFDDLVITSLDFAKDLLGEPNKVSAVEIQVSDNSDIEKVRNKWQKTIGDQYILKNREQQNPALYKTVKSEKWIVLFIVAIIGVIAIFNIIGTLTMLVIDKRKDMIILKSLGGNTSFIQNIFFFEGLLIAFLGSTSGIVLGMIFCQLQLRYGMIKTAGASLFEAYPVEIRYGEYILIFFTVMVASALLSYISAKMNIKQLNTFQLEPSE